ncbi:MAG: hypothetical protein ACRC1K_04020, partial [Planctomycetia bacterium]
DADYDAIKDQEGFRHWKAIGDNRETAFGEHRDPRKLVTNRPEWVVRRATRSLRPPATSQAEPTGGIKR